jgi:HEAT repeat protein
MAAALLARKQWSVMRQKRSRRIGPQIHEALAMHAIGIDQHGTLEKLLRQSRADVRETLFAMIASTRGEPHERIAALAKELGFLDRGGQKSIDWIRDFIRLGHSTHFDEIVSWVSTQNLMVRAIAAEELESYAGQIGEPQIAHQLHSNNVDVVMTVLDMLRAWRRALHVRNFGLLLAHSDPRVRARALLALPYAAADTPAELLEPAILASLPHENAEVRAAAANAAGRIGTPHAANALRARLNDPDRTVALAAAAALASLGEKGTALLEETVLSSDRVAAALAFEALEKSALGLVELA